MNIKVKNQGYIWDRSMTDELIFLAFLTGQIFVYDCSEKLNLLLIDSNK